MTGMHLVRSVHAVTIRRAGADFGQVGVPDVMRLIEIDTRGFMAAACVVKTKLDPFGMFREQREIGAVIVTDGTEPVRESGFDPHAVNHPRR